MSRGFSQYAPLALAAAGVVFLILGIVNLVGDDGVADIVATPSTTSQTVVITETTPAPTIAPPPTPSTAPPSAPSASPTTASPPTTAVPATTTTLPPPTTTSIPPETPEEFLALFVEGLRGNTDFLVARLNQATIDIYGLEQCMATFNQVIDAQASLEIREVAPAGPWDYVIDEIVTPIEDAVGVEVQRLAGGQTIIQELHWKLVDGLWTWFSDCGEPLAG